MDYVREMEIWSSPGRQYQESLSGEMATSFLSDLKLSSDIFITLSSVPSEIDCQNLRTSFDEGELEIEDFETFCIESGVEFDACNPLSACRFWNSIMDASLHGFICLNRKQPSQS